jgi:hypothetical protein
MPSLRAFLTPLKEADMDPIIEEFVHQQNLRRFQTLLAETKDEPRRHLLSNLLAEEEAKDHRHCGPA